MPRHILVKLAEEMQSNAFAGVPSPAPTARGLGFAPSKRRALLRMSPKTKCLWKPAQSGKTRTIMEMIREQEELAAHLNIVICANIRMQVEQLSSRVKRELFYAEDGSDLESTGSQESASMGDDRIEGDSFTWMSGTKDTNIRTGDLADKIKEDDVTMVVCCAHKKRLVYLMELLQNLEKSKHFKKSITVWIDEADASVKLWSRDELDFARFTKVSRVNLVSATFNSVIASYGRITVMGFDTTHPDVYLPLNECTMVTHDSYANPTANLMSVVESHPEICFPGSRLFAPALIERKTHDEVADYLKSKGFAVMILNGERKCIELPNGTIIPIKMDITAANPDEIATILPRLYAKHRLARFPFAVTGQLCLGRGITFQSGPYDPKEELARGRKVPDDAIKHAGFVFDYGVIPDLPDAAAAYQCVARLLGNVKSFPGYTPPTVFMSEKTKSETLACEKIAVQIAKQVQERGWADVGEEEIDHVLFDGDEEKLAVAAEHRKHAEAPKEAVEFSADTFETAVAAKQWAVERLTHTASAMYPCNAEGGKDGVCDHFKYRGELRAIASLEATLASGDLAWGQGGWDAKAQKPTATGQPRVLPVMVDGTIRYLVVFKPFYRKA